MPSTAFVYSSHTSMGHSVDGVGSCLGNGHQVLGAQLLQLGEGSGKIAEESFLLLGVQLHVLLEAL